MLAVCVFFVFWLSPAVLARQVEISQKPFKAEASLVQVPVIVQSHGQFVPELSKQDFRVYLGGEEQSIATFERVRPEPIHDSAPSPETQQFSNLSPELTRPRQFVILVVSTLANNPEQAQRARIAALRFVESVAGKNIAIAIIAVNSQGAEVVQALTSDTSLLAEAARRLLKATFDSYPGTREDKLEDVFPPLNDPSASVPFKADARTDSMISEMTKRLDTALSDSFHPEIQRAMGEMTINTLKAIAHAYEGLPGRKSVLWVGVPTFPSAGGAGTWMHYHTEEMFEALANSNISVYPIDARLAGYSYFDFARDNMKYIAERTGGEFIFHRWDLAHAIERAVNDSRAYYMLSFYLKPGTKRGWHRLKVKVDRSGTEIRTRAGVMIGKPIAPSDLPADYDIVQALNSYLPYTGVPFLFRWSPPGEIAQSGKKQVDYEIVLGPRAMSIDFTDNNHTSITVITEIRKPNGEPVAKSNETIEGHPNGRTVKAIQVEGFVHKGHAVLAPGTYSAVILVRDNLSKKIGTLTAPLTVP